MINTITGRNVHQTFEQALQIMRLCGKSEESRNGPVVTLQSPTIIEIERPWERVLWTPERKANPFFHLLEFVWMLAGSRSSQWISQFNSRMKTYAEDDGTINGAYGYRWKVHWGMDQIAKVIDKLRLDQSTRQAVLTMWDPALDLAPHRDIPCNTHIYFRIVDGKLHMMVCNRSNDLVWGAFGANAVHMTYLHELVARSVGVDIGMYRVMTNNLHIYKDLPIFNDLWDHTESMDHYRNVTTYPLLSGMETYEMLVEDAHALILETKRPFKTHWFNEVAFPMFVAYMDRLQRRSSGKRLLTYVMAEDWRLACQQYVERKRRSL